MTISSLTIPSYTSQLASPSVTGNNVSALPTSSGSIGDQLLAALAQAQSASGASSDPLLQDLVSLSPAALGQTTTAPQTYNAQGLLQQIQNDALLNDPLLQSETSGTTSDSLLQSLTPLSQISNMTTNALGSLNAATSTQASATKAGSADLNTNLSQLLNQDPAFASVLMESQIDQGLLSML